MSLPPVPPEPKKPGVLTVRRVVIWLVVGAAGLSLLIWGIVGMIAKGG